MRVAPSAQCTENRLVIWLRLSHQDINDISNGRCLANSASLARHASDEIPILRSFAEFGINLFPMKRLLLFLIMSAAFLCDVFASDSLPFPVSVGGQTAKDGMIIVNVNAVNAKNEPVPGATSAVILLQGKTKTN